MASKAAKRRNKKSRAQGKQAAQAGYTPQTVTRPHAGKETARPTPERKRRGVWIEPNGAGKSMQPTIDTANDMIGMLHYAKCINSSQEQAARLFMGLWAGYQAELEIASYKSCLAGGISGHDDGDGDIAAIRAYRSLTDKIGRVKTAALQIETVKGPMDKPVSIMVLRRALDAVTGA